MTPNELLLVLWDAALKGALLLALAGVAAFALRRASAAVRHLVWSVAACGALLLPVLSFVLPEWRVPWVPDWRQPVLNAAVVPETPVRPPETLQPRREVPRDFVESENVTPARETEAPVQPSAPAINARPVEPRRSSGLAPWLPRLWLAGAVVAALPLLLGWLQVRRLFRSSRPVTDPKWLEQRDAVSGKLRLRRRIQLRLSPHTKMPMTWGACRAVLLLPADAAEWSPARRRVVLLHELAHVKRFDWLTQTLAYLACALYWFNPLAWLAARRMRIEREQACDDLVLHCGSRPSDYADELLKLAAGMSGHRLLNWAAVPMARRSSLEDRLCSILDDRRNRTALTGLAIVAALILLAVIVVPMAMMKAESATDSSKETQTEVVIWQAIVDGTTFNALRSGQGTVEKTNAYRAEMLDGARLLATLKSAQSDGGLVDFDERMVWLRTTNPRVGDKHIINLMSNRQRQEAPGITAQTASLQCIGFHEFTASEQLAKLDLEFTPHAQFQQLKPDGSDFLSAESKPAGQPVKWKGTIAGGGTVCFSAPLKGNLGSELHHAIFVQAVASPRDLAAHLRGITSTARWLADGAEGALAVSRQAKEWEANATKLESIATASQPQPDGLAVRILAVGQPGRWPHRWWSLDGVPIKGNPAWQQSVGDAGFAVAFQDSSIEGGVSKTFQTPDDPGLHLELSSTGSSEFVPASSVYSLSSNPPERLQQYLDDGGRMDLVIQHGIGSWQGIGRIHEGETVEADGGRFALDKVQAFGDRINQPPGLILQVVLDGRYDFDPAFDIAIVAVDHQGRRTRVGNSSGSGLFSRREGRRIYQSIQISKKDIDHFAILKRPVKTYTFADLPTRAREPLTARLPGDGPDEVTILSKRPVTEAALQTLTNKPGLVRLDLSISGVSDVDLKYLAGLKQLRWLDLSQSRSPDGQSITDAGLTNLSGLTKLESLQLHGHPITDAGLEQLRPLRWLERLQLGATRVTGSSLTSFPRLRWLRLDSTPITDDDLRHLGALTNLEQLYLDGTAISDAGLVYLRSLKKLKSLNLHETQVTPAGVEALKQALPGLVVGYSASSTPASSSSRREEAPSARQKAEGGRQNEEGASAALPREELRRKLAQTEAALNQILTSLNVFDYASQVEICRTEIAKLKEEILGAQKELAQRKALLENVTLTNTSGLNIAVERARIESLVKRIAADGEILASLQAQAKPLIEAGPRIAELSRRRDEQAAEYERSRLSNPPSGDSSESISARLQAAEAQAARLTELHKANLVSASELERAQGKLALLRAEASGNPAETVRLKVQQAEEDLVRVQALRDKNLVSETALREAQANLDLARAEATGDPKAATRVRLQQAEADLLRLTELRRNNLVSATEWEAAQGKVDLLKAEAASDMNAAGRVKIRMAETEFARIQDLHERKLVSETEFQNAQAKLDLARAEATGNAATAARVRLRSAETDLARLTQLHANALVSDTELRAAQARVEALRAELENARTNQAHPSGNPQSATASPARSNAQSDWGDPEDGLSVRLRTASRTWAGNNRVLMIDLKTDRAEFSKNDSFLRWAKSNDKLLVEWDGEPFILGLISWFILNPTIPQSKILTNLVQLQFRAGDSYDEFWPTRDSLVQARFGIRAIGPEYFRPRTVPGLHVFSSDDRKLDLSAGTHMVRFGFPVSDIFVSSNVLTISSEKLFPQSARRLGTNQIPVPFYEYERRWAWSKPLEIEIPSLV